jgi:hypothetical protein
MSTQTWRTHKEREKRSIVYDPFREALSKEVILDEGSRFRIHSGGLRNCITKNALDYEKVSIAGKHNPVSIFLEIGEGTAKSRSLLARVDLGQLGWTEWLQRHLGHTQEIWVKGKVPPSTIRERGSWPREGKSGYGLET